MPPDQRACCSEVRGALHSILVFDDVAVFVMGLGQTFDCAGDSAFDYGF